MGSKDVLNEKPILSEMYKNWRICAKFYMRISKNKYEEMTVSLKFKTKSMRISLILNINDLKLLVVEHYKQKWN